MTAHPLQDAEVVESAGVDAESSCSCSHVQNTESSVKKDESAATIDPMKKSRRVLALSLAALGVLFRPTNVVIWLYPGVLHLVQTHDRGTLIFLQVLPIAVVTLGAMLLIDRWGYGEWTFVPLNFLKFNVLEVGTGAVAVTAGDGLTSSSQSVAFGTQGKDSLYGVKPWGWYFTQGFPAIVGTALPLTVAGFLTVPVRASRSAFEALSWSLLAAFVLIGEEPGSAGSEEGSRTHDHLGHLPLQQHRSQRCAAMSQVG